MADRPGEHLTPGGDAVLGSKRNKWNTMKQKSASTGQLGRSSIPGYTGHVPGRNSENVNGLIYHETSRMSETLCSKRMVPRSGADSERGRQWNGHDIMAR